MGDGVNPAAIDQRQPVGRETGRHGDAVGAVPVEQQGRRTIDGRRFAAQHRHRHQLTVGCRRVQPLDHIVFDVVTGRDLLRFAQGPLARRHVVVERLRRRRRRVVGVACGRRLVFGGAGQRQGEGRFVDRDLMLGAGPIADDDAGVGVGTFLTRQVIIRQVQAFDEAARRVRHQIGPVRLGWRCGRGLDDLEIDGVVRIGADHPAVAPVIDVVAGRHHARLEHNGFGCRSRGRDIARLGRFLVLDADDDELVVGRAAHADEHAVVGFLIDKSGLAAARRATEDLVRTAVVVAVGPENPLAVRRENEVAGGAVDHLGQHLAGRQILDVDLVDLGTLGVLGIGEKAVIRAVARGGHFRIGLALGQLVGVQQQLRRGSHDEILRHRLTIHHPGALTLDAHVAGVLIAGLVFDVVVPAAIRRGNRAVVFLDAAAHLAEQRLLQGQGGSHHGLAVGVLGGQVVLNLGLDQGRIAQDRLPVVVLHPLIVVGPGAAQLFDDDRDFLGDGRLRHGRSGGLTGERGGGRNGEGGRRRGHDQLPTIHRTLPACSKGGP